MKKKKTTKKKVTKKIPASTILSKQELFWQAEEDANILQQAQALLADKQRLLRAQAQAKKMIAKNALAIQNLKKVITKK